jgi:hypothetical protein
MDKPDHKPKLQWKAVDGAPFTLEEVKAACEAGYLLRAIK